VAVRATPLVETQSAAASHGFWKYLRRQEDSSGSLV